MEYKRIGYITCKTKGVRCTVYKVVLLLLAIVLLLLTDVLRVLLNLLREPQHDVYPSEIDERLALVLRDVELMKLQNQMLRDSILKHISPLGSNSEEDKEEMLQQFLLNFRRAQVLIKNQKSFQVETNANLEINVPEPSTRYELTRRRVENGIREIGFYFGAQLCSELENLTLGQPQLWLQISNMIQEAKLQERTLHRMAQRLRETDGYEKWRQQEARELTELVQEHVYRSQNPRNCSDAKFLVCGVPSPCGYACQVNHVFYCLVQAFGLQRTMILESNKWTKYLPSNWTDAFLPVSNCTFAGNATKWPGSSNDRAITMQIFLRWLFPKPEFLPLGIPRELAARIKRLHGDPPAWWVGQFWLYLLRFQPTLTRFIEQADAKLNFRKPVVGVHIRRTDKLKFEAKYHALEEYMSVVEEYYTQLELSQHVEKRRVFIATDDPSVFAEAKEKYPDYEVLGDPNVSKAAGKSRFDQGSLYDIVTDIHFLAHSDFIVCTFSSGVCRLAYEIMQSLHVDASAKYRSLDDIYLSSGQQEPRLRQAVLPHRALREQEISLEVGDVVEVAGNHWDGFSLGTNRRTGKQGLYPSHKVEEKLALKDFPAFRDVKS